MKMKRKSKISGLEIIKSIRKKVPPPTKIIPNKKKQYNRKREKDKLKKEILKEF